MKTSLPVQGLGRDGAKTLPMRFDLVASIRSARGPMIKRFRPVAAPYSDGDRPLTCLRARRRDKYERAPAVKRSSLQTCARLARGGRQPKLTQDGGDKCLSAVSVLPEISKPLNPDDMSSYASAALRCPQLPFAGC